MTVTGCPRARRDLQVHEVGREGMLYDRDGELIHILNVTALEVWKACDGETSIEAIEGLIRAKFAASQGHDVAGDIEKLLAQLSERGLLETFEPDRTQTGMR